MTNIYKNTYKSSLIRSSHCNRIQIIFLMGYKSYPYRPLLTIPPQFWNIIGLDICIALFFGLGCHMDLNTNEERLVGTLWFCTCIAWMNPSPKVFEGKRGRWTKNGQTRKPRWWLAGNTTSSVEDKRAKKVLKRKRQTMIPQSSCMSSQ